MTPRARLAARLVAVALLAGAAGVGWAATRAPADDTPAARRGPRPSPTPLWSPRRVPSLLVEEVGRQRLAAAAAAFGAPYTACLAVTGDGAVLARDDADVPLAPASTVKLLTGAAALTALGPEHRFVTRVVASAAPAAGVVAGDLWLVGGGDPVLATPGYAADLAGEPRTRTDPTTPLADLADALADAGIRRIEGAVLGDDRRHETARTLPSWKASYRVEVGPLGALVVDDGWADPASRVPAADPAVHAAQQFAALLEARGVTVAGGAGRGGAPDGAVEVAAVRSPTLAAIVAGMLTSSDNLTAEVLVREVGVERAGAGTTAAGTAAVAEVLADLGIPTGGLALVDGSGLSPDDRVTCDALAAAVALGTRPDLAPLRDGLAVAGETGTLALRFAGDPLAGRVRAKTGQIAGVVGFAGVVEDERTLEFAFVANGPFSTASGQALQVEVARLVAAYPDAPPAPELVPGVTEGAAG